MDNNLPIIENQHDGRQVKRFRESIGMKQETLALEVGTSQQNISNYENKETLDEKLFAQLAEGMGVKPEILRSFHAEAPIFHIKEMKDNSAGIMYNPTFNPIDKIMEQSSKIESLYKDLLKSEQEKIKVLTDANKAVLKLAEEMKKQKEGKK